MISLLISLLLPFTALAQAAAVQPGIETLKEPEWTAKFVGKRIGILAHHASRDSEGTHLIDLMKDKLGLDVKLIFAPEHGLRSAADDWVSDGVDAQSGLPVYSLYLRNRRAPEAAQLAQIDVIVADLQDVGMRYYTFGSTLALTMQAAKAAGKPVFVLDRPNPLGGEKAEGLQLASSLTGNFISFYPISTRHGLTLGELSLLYNQEFGIGSDLTVVPMKGWTRSMLWEDTGLSWPEPSPALVSADQSSLYSFVGVFEAYNLAVGRGVTNEDAFRVIGAPWISTSESQELARRLSTLSLPGISFEAAAWTATRATFEGQKVRGVRVKLVDFRKVDSFEASVRMAQVMSKLFGSRLKAGDTAVRYWGADWVLSSIQAQTSWSVIQARAARESQIFFTQRSRAILY